jgi:hypothetical protein
MNQIDYVAKSSVQSQEGICWEIQQHYYSGGQLLFKRGEPCEDIFMIVDGFVEIFSYI